MCNSYESRSVSARAESYKKVRKQILKKFFLPPHVFWDPGSEIWDPGSGIRDGKKSGSGIRDKHPGSATLIVTICSRSREHLPNILPGICCCNVLFTCLVGRSTCCNRRKICPIFTYLSYCSYLKGQSHQIFRSCFGLFE
jgi:hypothetical protein